MKDKEKILVVEDNDFVRMQLVRFLNDEGYSTSESRDGTAALQAISEDVNLAIVDVRMQPMDGFEFVRKLRNSNIHTPVILVTGDDNPGLLNESSKWGIHAVLKKPVQKDRLLKTVSRTLQMERRTMQ